MMYIYAILLLASIARSSAVIAYKAKFMGNVRAAGEGDALVAYSLTHCLALCNKDHTCDAVNYHDELGKCRIFKRCAPIRILDKSEHYWMYAKRPIISASGYAYEERSDSCLKIMNEAMDYESAQQACMDQKGYLAVLDTLELRNLALKLMVDQGCTLAWINSPVLFTEAFGKHRALTVRRKSTGTENIYDNECWMLQYNNSMEVYPCQQEKIIGICQIPSY